MYSWTPHHASRVLLFTMCTFAFPLLFRTQTTHRHPIPVRFLQLGRKLEGAVFILSVTSTPQYYSARCDSDCPRLGPCKTNLFPTRHSSTLSWVSATRFALARSLSFLLVVRSLSFLRDPRVGQGVWVIILQALNTSGVDTPKSSGC